MRMIIGLTGGIGSGKSTVAAEFKALGIEVVDADKVAREVVAPGKAALREIVQYFGATIINAHGELDRAKLRNLIFQSESKKKWLNALLHPMIRELLITKLTAATSDYVILEAPLLFENNLTEYTQYNIVVDLPESLQIQRAMKRDGNTETQIKAIINAQISRKQRLKKADIIIDNSGNDFDALKSQVNSLHIQLLSHL